MITMPMSTTPTSMTRTTLRTAIAGKSAAEPSMRMTLSPMVRLPGVLPPVTASATRK